MKDALFGASEISIVLLSIVTNALFHDTYYFAE